MEQKEYWDSVSGKKEFTTPFQAGEFSKYVNRDAVILFAVLTCIRTNEEQKELLAEIKRILKPQGILYVNDFLLNTDERNLLRYEKYKEAYGVYGVFELPDGAVCRHHEEAWIKQLLEDFLELEFSRMTFTTMNGNQSKGFYFIGRLNHPQRGR